MYSTLCVIHSLEGLILKKIGRTSVLGSVFGCVSPFEPEDPVMGGVLGVVAVPPSRSSITKSIGIFPFKQLMYRWQKLSHNSWTCDLWEKKNKNLQ